MPRLHAVERRLVPGGLDFVPVLDERRLRAGGVGHRAGHRRRQQEPIVEGFQVEVDLPTGPPIVSKSRQHGCVSLSNSSGLAAVEVSVRRGTNQSGQDPILGVC